MALIQQYEWIFHVILVILALMLLLCLIRAIKGPRIADRLVAVNMMGTMVMVIISILAVIKNEGYLVDICLIYAMISFLAVVVLTKVYTGVYLEAKAKKRVNSETANERYSQQKPQISNEITTKGNIDISKQNKSQQELQSLKEITIKEKTFKTKKSSKKKR